MSGNEKYPATVVALLEFSELVNSTLDIQEIRQRATETAARLLRAETGSLLVADEQTGGLYFDVVLGEKGSALKDFKLRKGEGIAGWVAVHDEPVVVNDVANETRFLRQADQKSGFETRNILCVPIRAKSRFIGVLQVLNRASGGFDEDDVSLLCALANQVGIAIENARLYEELRSAFFSTVHSFADAIEMRDPFTGGHTRRVTTYCLAIGRMLDLPLKDMSALKLAAILHDVGMMGIKDEMLGRSARSPADQQGMVRLHVDLGVRMLQPIKALRESLPGVRHHHEHYDGSGYPDQLQGDAIPLLARIIAVADGFDSMVFGRPYQKILGYEEAFRMLSRLAGVFYDAKIVDAFLKAYKEFKLDRVN